MFWWQVLALLVCEAWASVCISRLLRARRRALALARLDDMYDRWAEEDRLHCRYGVGVGATDHRKRG